jgi:hypothetical protein
MLLCSTNCQLGCAQGPLLLAACGLLVWLRAAADQTPQLLHCQRLRGAKGEQVELCAELFGSMAAQRGQDRSAPANTDLSLEQFPRVVCWAKRESNFSLRLERLSDERGVAQDV